MHTIMRSRAVTGSWSQIWEGLLRYAMAPRHAPFLQIILGYNRVLKHTCILYLVSKLMRAEHLYVLYTQLTTCIIFYIA